MLPIIIIICAFVGVTALVGGVALLVRGQADDALEDRLEVLAGTSSPGSRSLKEQENLLISRGFDDVPGMLEQTFSRLFNVRLLLEQGDLTIAPVHFIFICLALGVVAAVATVVAGVPAYFAPISAVTAAVLPLGLVFFKRKQKRDAFAKQLPEALELIARALRAGHSLSSGFQLVGEEMTHPIGTEFFRTFEEQNFGIPLEEAMESLTERVPNLDLKFFATAIVLQRQTGGDLAEILDKIGHLIRERFKIFGAVQALTGEGRLSGIVLLAMPPVLFCVMMGMNYDYVMMLFEDPMGKQMLAVTGVLQVVGALVIRKIVNIKV